MESQEKQKKCKEQEVRLFEVMVKPRERRENMEEQFPLDVKAYDELGAMIGAREAVAMQLNCDSSVISVRRV